MIIEYIRITPIAIISFILIRSAAALINVTMNDEHI